MRPIYTGLLSSTCLLTSIICLITCLTCQVTKAQDTRNQVLPPGTGQFEFIDQDGNPNKTIRVYYVKPLRTTPNTPVWFVMHGVNRNAEDYRNNWVELSDRYRATILVPEFSAEDYPGSRAYNLGNMFDEQGEPVDRSLWSYTLIDRLFDHVVQREGSKARGYCIFGHSAGAQFVHRLVLFVPDAKVRMAVSANAGWYTIPDLDVPYPYGLAGTSATEDDLRIACGKPLRVMLGKDDNDPNHKHLRKTPEAEVQGPHRLARGRYFFNQTRAIADTLELSLAWRRIEVPGVGHSNSRMAPVAAKLMARAPRIRDDSSE